MTVLGKRMKACREAAGVTQQEMADACRLSKNYISALERGVNKCSAQTLIAYADRLGMTVDCLIGTGKDERIIPELRHVLNGMPKDMQEKVLQIIKIISD